MCIATMVIDSPGQFNSTIASRPCGAHTLSRAWSPGFSNDLQRVVKLCCAFDPDDRPTLDQLHRHIQDFMTQPAGQCIAAYRGPIATEAAFLPRQDWRNDEVFRPDVPVLDAFYRHYAFNPDKNGGLERVVPDAPAP
jgi:hypothetical protein